MDLIISVVVLLILLVCIWGAVWVVQTYIVAGAPFIADPFKQIVNWIIMVVAVLVSLVLVLNWVGSISGSAGLSGFHLPLRR